MVWHANPESCPCGGCAAQVALAYEGDPAPGSLAVLQGRCPSKGVTFRTWGLRAWSNSGTPLAEPVAVHVVG